MNNARLSHQKSTENRYGTVGYWLPLFLSKFNCMTGLFMICSVRSLQKLKPSICKYGFHFLNYIIAVITSETCWTSSATNHQINGKKKFK